VFCSADIVAGYRKYANTFGAEMEEECCAYAISHRNSVIFCVDVARVCQDKAGSIRHWSGRSTFRHWEHHGRARS